MTLLEKKLLQTRQLDLKMIIDICRANESSSRQVREMRATDDVQKLHSSRKPQPVDVGTRDVPRRSKPQQRASQPIPKCKFCGQEHKFQKEICPAFGRTCKKCKKPNHFADMCRSRFKNVRFADMENSSDKELLVLESQREAEYPKRIYARLELAGEVFKFQLDSGASVNVLPESIYRTAVGDKRLLSPQLTVFVYDNSELKTSEILTTTVRNPKTNQAYELDFYVVPRHRQPILDASACQLMELIRVRSENIFITDNISNHQLLTQNNILQSYKDVSATTANSASQFFNEELECVNDTSSFQKELEIGESLRFLVASESLKNALTTSSRHDPVISELRTILQYGWPDNANQLPEHLRPFFTFRDELVIENDLLFKGNRLYVPAESRSDILQRIHSSHLGDKDVFAALENLSFGRT